jgi:hypothetical protein
MTVTPTPAPVPTPTTVNSVETTVKADAATVKADAIAVDSKLTAFIKANAGKIAVGVLVAAALIVWHFV